MQYTVSPIHYICYTHCFVLSCIVLIISTMDSCDLFTCMLYGCFTSLGQFYYSVSASAMTLKDMNKIAMDPGALSHSHIYYMK